MRFESAICTDIGIVKKVNQDAALVRQAETDLGTVLLAVVCDGMGGLQKGELASSTVIAGMSDWFEQVFPRLLYNQLTPDVLRESWTQVLNRLNEQIRIYGDRQGIQLGTTITALLLVKDAYYICNVGDSRTYYLTDAIWQLTRDQTYVQHEMDMGRMTEEEAKQSSQHNVLLQCIGVGEGVEPDFYNGEFSPFSAFLLCSDGFRHVISPEEMLNELYPSDLAGQEDMDRRLRRLVDVVKQRREEDNITAVLIHTL